jgi:hypothetical protein
MGRRRRARNDWQASECGELRRLERPPRRLRTTCAECTGWRRGARGTFDPGQTSHVPALTRPACPNGRTIISDLPGDLYALPIAGSNSSLGLHRCELAVQQPLAL